MSEFTKGNWSIRRKEFHPPHIASENNLGVPICYMAACFDEDSANAHLISACPEMYEALKDMICAVNMARQEQHIRSFGDDLRTCAYDETAEELSKKIADIVERARIALAKAEGKE